MAEALRQSTKQLCRNLKDNPNVAENMAKVAAERQTLQLLLSNTLNELEVFFKIQPVLESVMAQDAAEVRAVRRGSQGAVRGAVKRTVLERLMAQDAAEVRAVKRGGQGAVRGAVAEMLCDAHPHPFRVDWAWPATACYCLSPGEDEGDNRA